jgi:hypothetical protein
MDQRHSRWNRREPTTRFAGHASWRQEERSQQVPGDLVAVRCGSRWRGALDHLAGGATRRGWGRDV